MWREDYRAHTTLFISNINPHGVFTLILTSHPFLWQHKPQFEVIFLNVVLLPQTAAMFLLVLKVNFIMAIKIKNQESLSYHSAIKKIWFLAENRVTENLSFWQYLPYFQ